MKLELLYTRVVGDIRLQYRIDRESGMVELNLLPASAPAVAADTKELTPLSSVKFGGDSAGCGFGGGRTMRYSETVSRFRFEKQEIKDREIRTVMRHDNGCRLLHYLSWQEELPVFFVHTELVNDSGETLEIELLESFALGGIGEGLTDREFADLKLHRFRSRWCNEASLETAAAADWQLERYPLNYVICNERYGQAGTLPACGFHSFGAAEDPVNHICWGAMPAWSGSWQMEYSMRNALGLALSGGLADREFGHWCKRLAPGETLAAPTAILSCVAGTLDELCARLVRGIESTLRLPASEEELPVIFNEWCTSWGEPSEQSLLAIAEKIKDLPVKYLVMDAGWYKKDDGSAWSSGQGDWQVNARLFPNGLAHAVAEIRKTGLVPGIWFEAEVIGNSADAWERDTAKMLRRDGKVITAGTRRFWNLADPAAFEILDQRIVQFLKENNLGYVKIDYNENVGVGCDHPDSPGEGVRQQVLGTHRFFKRLREVNPDLVIENCASGGHRLEPAMFGLSSMSSFSDAHESDTIPVIAGSLHRLMPVRQMQIWAVMRPAADLKHIVYLLTSAMLGRLCLSGDILQLSEQQFDTVKRALTFYRQLVPVLKDGDSQVIAMTGKSRKCLTGCQIVSRLRRDGKQLALWFHAFDEAPESMRFALPAGKWQLTNQFSAPDTGKLQLNDREVILTAPAAMSGHVVLLDKME